MAGNRRPIVVRNSNGIVRWFNDEKRFGFITSDHGDLFVHMSSILATPQTLRSGQLVTFDICDAPKGLQAIDVVLTEGRQPHGRRSTTRASSAPNTGRSLSSFQRETNSGSSYKAAAPVVQNDGSGFDTDRFENEVPEELVCAICQGVLNSPVQTECEHLFCRRCIDRWMEEHPSCPIDREPLSRHNLRTVPRFVKSMIGSLKLSCDFADRGCKSVVCVDELSSHVAKCPHGRQSRGQNSQSASGTTSSGFGSNSRTQNTSNLFISSGLTANRASRHNAAGTFNDAPRRQLHQHTVSFESNSVRSNSIEPSSIVGHYQYEPTVFEYSDEFYALDDFYTPPPTRGRSDKDCNIL